MSQDIPKKLKLTFHGRVIDHLGIQMYQSPVAAIAELISNSWDADAEKVEVALPSKAEPGAVIIIKDDGNGMAFDDCQNKYLNVGYDCRDGVATAKSAKKNRPVLGRKGIGKFAGFGIAQRLAVETISAKTGERTVFDLGLAELRGSNYIEQGGEIPVKEYSGPSDDLKKMHGTTITLHGLSLQRAQNVDTFARSMSRRFLLAQRADDFRILVNGAPIPEDSDVEKAEFIFPKDYEDSQKPTGLVIDEDGWGKENIGNGRMVRWRFHFYPEPIKEDELRGISIFANGKLAQRPFMFNIIGGISGQQGLEYLSGRVEADYIDSQETDLIATERQRINWEHEEALPLLDWGTKRIDALCRIWKERRAAGKLKVLENKLATFAARLSSLPKSEQRTVRRALIKLAQVSSLTTKQFEELGNAILTSWEAGRLKELINDLSDSQQMSSDNLVDLLIEANVLTALNTFEAVKTKVAIIEGLKERIDRGELENAVRDYIAENPWLISAEWETFKKETSVRKVIENIIAEKKIDPAKEWGRRIDLVLGSGDTLLVLEFMQPGRALDYDHLNRFGYYVDSIRAHLQVNQAFQYKRCTGYLVAGSLSKDPALAINIQTMRNDFKFAYDWPSLLATAEKKYEEFIVILRERAPEDARLRDLKGE